jgi:hypothetical protein
VSSRGRTNLTLALCSIALCSLALCALAPLSHAQDPVPVPDGPPPPSQTGGSDQPPKDKPDAQKPPSDKPATDKPAGEQGGADKPAAQPPGTSDQSTEKNAGAPTSQDPNDPQASKPIPTAATSAFDYGSATSEAAYTTELQSLLAKHSGRLRRSSLGRSRSGRDIVLLTLTDLADGDPDKKPAVLLVTGLDPSFDAHPAGPQAALFAARDLLERAVADPATAAWLARTSVYVLPAPDPDATFAPDKTPPRACRLDHNFPSEWKPWSSETCAQGPYPLSEPETRSIARFLSQRSNVGAVVLLSRGADLSDAGAPVDESELERILFARVAAADAAASEEDRRVAAEALARRSQAFERESGSLSAFCRERLSAFLVPLDPFASAVGDTPLGRAPSGFTAIAGTIARLARELPRLSCTVDQSERLRERLWKIDVTVENQGLLPTLPDAERDRCVASVWFEATGGRVAQVGVSRGGAADTNALLRPPATWMLGHLDGREKIKLHVLVEAAEGTTVQLSVQTLREGQTQCAVTLH